MGGPHPNILYIMTDQQRFDTIAALGSPLVRTPNLDRLVRRGVSFTNAYSPCPVCVPARYIIRTGCAPATTGVFENGGESLEPGQPLEMEERCGPFLGRRMSQLGYRTFGIGKFHSHHDDLGYETFLRAEEMWSNPEERAADSYIQFLEAEHPAFAYLEQPHGERTEMYYMPQLCTTTAEATHEGWAAGAACREVTRDDGRPWFGFVSFIGPHPPCAPPIPFNRLYDPDRMPAPVGGVLAEDHADEHLPWMNYMIWAEDVGPMQARAFKARYYGEISFIDACLGRILDAVESRGDADNTLIAFFSDHGEHCGDHHAWQKESFFDASARIPLLVSWPARLPANQRNTALASLQDLFATATAAAGCPEPREGIDLAALASGGGPARDCLAGVYGFPGTPRFKVMIRRGYWKYIFLSNGNRRQLFHLGHDPHERHNLGATEPRIAEELHALAVAAANRPGSQRALGAAGLRSFEFEARPLRRVYQFDASQGVQGFRADACRLWRDPATGPRPG